MNRPTFLNIKNNNTLVDVAQFQWIIVKWFHEFHVNNWRPTLPLELGMAIGWGGVNFSVPIPSWYFMYVFEFFLFLSELFEKIIVFSPNNNKESLKVFNLRITNTFFLS